MTKIPSPTGESGSVPETGPDWFGFILELRTVFEEIEKGETMNQRRSTTWEDTPGKRFFKQYVPRPMTIRDAKDLAHHAVLKINRWTMENPDV